MASEVAAKANMTGVIAQPGVFYESEVAVQKTGLQAQHYTTLHNTAAAQGQRCLNRKGAVTDRVC